VNDGELESMKLITKSKNKNIPLGQIQMGRKRGEREFKGDWNGTISSTDLVRYLPTLSLVDAKIKGGGQISFDSVSRLFDLEIIAEFSVSSIFFPKEGLVKGNVQSRIEFIDQNWRIKELNMHIENDDGEKIEVHIDEPIDRSKKLGELNFSLVDFELGRFNQHFSKEAKINGNFKTIITPSFILLDSDNAFYNDSLIEQKHISISIKLPLNLSSNKEAGIKFDFKVLPVVEIFTHLLPPVINQKKQFSLQNLRVTGQVTNSGWIVESSSLEMFNYDMRVGEIKVGNLLLNHKVDKGFEWSSINSPNNLESTFYIENLDTEFSLVIKNLNLIGSFKDLKGKIIFDNGYPQLVCENFIVDGLLTDQNSNILQGVQIKGDLQFDPKSKTYEQFQINKLEVWGDDEELLKGEISLSLKEDAAVVGLKSREIDISLSTVRFFPIPQILNLKNQKIEANKLEWQFSGENELKLDGLIRLTKPDSNEFLNIPVNWTFVEKGEEISHWIQLSFKKDLKSDLEINFQSGSNFVSYRGDRLNIVDLLPVFKSLLRPLSKSKVFDFGNFLNQFDKNAILSLKTLILSPKIKLENFEAKYNNLNKTISFTSLFGESVIDGELNFQSLDGNSSNFSIFKFVINGRETNATILNSIVSGNVLLGGSMNWELGVNGTLGGDYETKCNGDFRNISFNFFSDNKANHTPMLKAEMENSLGNSFSWSATQSKLMEVFVILLRNIRFDNGSFELNRSDSGHWKFSIKDWVSSELNLLGNGELTPQGNFKMNLFPSVKGEWAGFLEVANLLAAGKVRKGYRTLKQEPLVFEGSNQRWNFTNWWNLFAQGIGLEPSE
jgi:hypothetical protein